LAPEVIWSESGPALAALLRATSKVPIIFTNVTDPVASGFVASLAHPGGNATGFGVSEPGLGPKWLEFLKAIAPQLTRVAIILQTDKPQLVLQDAITAAAPRFGVTLT